MFSFLLVAVFFAVFSILIFIGKPNKDRATIYIVVMLSFAFVLIFMYIIKADNLEVFDKPIYFILLPIFAYFLYKKGENTFLTKLEVIARRSSAWGVSPKRILNRFSHRIHKKKGRNEIEVEPQSTFYTIKENGLKSISMTVMDDIRDYDYKNNLTKIDDISFFTSKKCPELYNVVFLKLLEVNEDLEKGIDFNKELRNNQYILEFFILDMFETLITDIPLGVATLNTLAETQVELDMVSAMDSVISTNVNRDGLELFALFAYSKGLVNNENKKIII